MDLRRLGPDDAPAFNDLRLEGLSANPTAFGSSYEEEVGQPLARTAERLADPHNVVVAADDGERLMGVVGLRRYGNLKERHKAYLWGMYLRPAARGQGLARRLVQAALDHAVTLEGLRQVNLSVEASNAAAITLYRSFGFEPYGVERHALVVDGVGYDEVHMTWWLPQAYVRT